MSDGEREEEKQEEARILARGDFSETPSFFSSHVFFRKLRLRC